MDSLTLLLLLSSLICTLLHFIVLPKSWYKKSANQFPLPPGPYPLPILGNLLHLGKNPHHSVTNLAKTYGPLMHLKLGSIHTIVASSPQMAREVLQKHDQIFSSRTVPSVAESIDHNKVSIAWLPVGNKWRKLRKICKEHLFTMQKLQASESLRQEKLKKLRDHLQERCKSSGVVNIGEAAFVTSLNLLSTTLFSVDFASYDSNSAQEMREIVQGLMKLLGVPNLADFFPVLKLIDPQGLKQKAGVYYGKVLDQFDEIISRRLESRGKLSDSGRKKDLLEVLLDVNQESDSELSRNDIKHLLLDLIVAGADTTTDSVQWAMAELLRNPEKMAKAKDELMTVIGENKQVEESDIPRLPYLRAVMKETFRCHPAGPFLVPHKAEADAEINGYLVPKNAQIFINIWAIGRDESVWSDPDSFEPERFLDSKIDYRGQDFELIAFGSGRRICPGMPLAHLMVHLMVATLIHNFDWKLENGMKPEELDLREMFGLSLHKAVPLKAFPVEP